MPAPITTRIVQRILAGAAAGEFQTTEMLPSERDFARTMDVSRSTVAAAYSELENRGVLRRVRGKGAFLCASSPAPEGFSWSGKVSRFAFSLDEPVLEQLARGCSAEFRFPLSAGTPSLEVFPRAEYAASISRVLGSSIPSALAVGSAEGRPELREALSAWLKVPQQHLMVTAGAQEGIDLIARCLVEQGDAVVIDSPCYPGALQSFLAAGARLIPWSVDWPLPQLEELLLRYRPKLICTTPTFQNPTGRTMSLKTRMGLLELAHRYGVPIVEDGVYNLASFREQPEPESLYVLDQHSLVIHCSTFSKILAPGLRIGWLNAPLYMIKQLSLIKMRSNLFTGGLNQLAMADLIRSGVLDQHLLRLRSHHRTLRDVAMQVFRPSIEHGLLRFRVPEGGLYLWCKVLFPLDMELLLEELEQRGLSVAPGSAFEADRNKAASSFFRLCYTAVDEESLRRAIGIINTVLARLAISTAARRMETVQHE